MSDRYKQEEINRISSLIPQLEKQRAEAVGKLQAAQQAAHDAQGDIDALDSNLAQAREALAQAEAA